MQMQPVQIPTVQLLWDDRVKMWHIMGRAPGSVSPSTVRADTRTPIGPTEIAILVKVIREEILSWLDV
uniref:Uncharacterized protein n=1 Tax=uncultured prokaryote TaxID=198431 RepID=A0A0H5Q5M8_9ZZZZ|nr:hypothetical protein [uncultured prokaryote]